MPTGYPGNSTSHSASCPGQVSEGHAEARRVRGLARRAGSLGGGDASFERVLRVD
ncbi:hypothetical protein LINGRAHAP2_LOCUS11953 [Linum grandiflorum]